ncbi:MAG TPA: ATPase, T2SS/T4P/T4SS family [Acidimicrobiia bacterium]|nr:ATPase, T2SS/T4P/T4SS family [Acidimicrobiia bacterium]
MSEPLGFLAPLLADPQIEEIIVLGGRRTFVVRDGEKALLPDVVDPDRVRLIADALLAGTGRRLDLAAPIVSAQLADGSRVHITGPPVTHPDRLNIMIRKFVMRGARLDDLVVRGTLTSSAADFLARAVRDDRTILVAGAPGAGKTTLLSCLLHEVDPDRRVVTCEEVFEVGADLPDMTQMQTRDQGLDGGGAVTLRELVRASLRQRPDLIVVGEVRGPEALDMVLALNAGCCGMATLHANSAIDALDKLIGYCVLAADNVAIPFVRKAVAASVDVVVFLRRTPDGRRIEEIAEVTGGIDGDTIVTRAAFSRAMGSLRWTGRPEAETCA